MIWSFLPLENLVVSHVSKHDVSRKLSSILSITVLLYVQCPENFRKGGVREFSEEKGEVKKGKGANTLLPCA